MDIVKKRAAELQQLAKDKGGDIANAAADKAKNIPGADAVRIEVTKCPELRN